MAGQVTIDGRELAIRLIKYLVEGLMVALCAFLLQGRATEWYKLVAIGGVAACTFAILDLFAPSYGASVRSGAGLGIGLNLVGFGANGMGPDVDRLFFR